jgi:phage tail sheath gpL-like
LLVPGVYTEVNGNRAASSSPTLPKRVYIVGHRASTGEVAAGTPFRATSDSESERCAGVGSQLAEMLRIFKYANPYVELWGIGLADGGSAVSAAESWHSRARARRPARSSCTSPLTGSARRCAAATRSASRLRMTATRSARPSSPL